MDARLNPYTDDEFKAGIQAETGRLREVKN
ncbi:hypothetical protein EV648_11872 [Kribbella sp. VKM Ac-2568]|nr:hypothetical protein EV648_11872 [Kribbella sp. VKM Ac-2568]